MFVGDLFTIQSFLQSKTTIVFHLLQGTFMPPKNRELLNQNDFISTPSGMRTGQSKVKKKVVMIIKKLKEKEIFVCIATIGSTIKK